jgi:phosphoribosylformylglycinamidine cyclo-ligase
MKGWVEKARRPEVIGGLGGFAGLFDASALKKYERAAAGDLHRRRRHQGRDRAGDGQARHDRLRPRRHGRRRPRRLRRRAAVHDRLHRLRQGRARADRRDRQGHRRGCVEAGCALVGGETAEHPGLLAPDEYDVAGADDRRRRGRRLLGPDRVRPGDVVIAMASSGLHSNGYSLVRHVCSTKGGWRSTATSTSSADARRGAARADPDLRQGLPGALADADRHVHAMAHITGGGLAANLARVMPEELSATLDRGTWTPQPIFDLVRRSATSPGRPRGHPQLRRRHGRVATSQLPALVRKNDRGPGSVVLTRQHT